MIGELFLDNAKFRWELWRLVLHERSSVCCTSLRETITRELFIVSSMLQEFWLICWIFFFRYRRSTDRYCSRSALLSCSIVAKSFSMSAIFDDWLSIFPSSNDICIVNFLSNSSTAGIAGGLTVLASSLRTILLSKSLIVLVRSSNCLLIRSSMDPGNLQWCKESNKSAEILKVHLSSRRVLMCLMVGVEAAINMFLSSSIGIFVFDSSVIILS